MKILPLHTNPFDLGAHLEDEHDLSALTIDLMDSEELRRTHVILHRDFQSFRRHMHEDESDLGPI